MRVALIVLAGCGRIAFDPLGDATVAGDVSAVDCWPSWMGHTITVSAPRVLAELVAGQQQGDGSITGDGLTLYYTIDTGTLPDVYRATRTAIGATWTPAGKVSEVSTAAVETRFSVGSDDLSAVMSAQRGASDDLFFTQRATTADPFSAPDATLFAATNTAQPDYDPELSANGLRVYYAPVIGGRQRLRMLRRAQLGDAFVAERTLDEIDPGVTFSDPSVSPDELVIAFSAMGPAKLFYATRLDPGGLFGAAIQIPTISMAGAANTDTELSATGCELYFTSNRTGARELYVADVR